MHAIWVREFGDASKLVYDELSMPEPEMGEVRVKVGAAGLNFTEIYHRKGLYPAILPIILGGELAGTVDALGEGVTEFQVGDHVATVNAMGSYADYAIVPAARLVKLPAQISVEQAAAVMLQGMTAHYLVYSTYPLKAGETALIHAAAGGVGLLLVQLAKKCGARVIATVSTEIKAELAREAGADDIILYSKDDFETETKRLTNDKGVDIVYDSVGKTTFAKSLNVLRPRGYLVLYGQASGAVEPLDPQVLNRKGSLFLTRPTLHHYIANREELLWRANDLFKWMMAGELKVRIDTRFPLANAASAHQYMEERETKGKVLLIP
ncbi:MAG: quinone oxidoreductase [Chloroflexota bacterium]